MYCWYAQNYTSCLVIRKLIGQAQEIQQTNTPHPPLKKQFQFETADGGLTLSFCPTHSRTSNGERSYARPCYSSLLARLGRCLSPDKF
eukprot:scaffold365982_cov28-Prasinocladus_malaysianus.AAC.1